MRPSIATSGLAPTRGVGLPRPRDYPPCEGVAPSRSVSAGSARRSRPSRHHSELLQLRVRLALAVLDEHPAVVARDSPGRVRHRDGAAAAARADHLVHRPRYPPFLEGSRLFSTATPLIPLPPFRFRTAI